MGNDEVWLSNPLNMNDIEELRFGMLEGANAFRSSPILKEACKDSTVHETLLKYFNQLLHEFDTQYAFNTYVLCLAHHDRKDNDGLLSMWRGYGAGGSGVAIVFDTAKIGVNDSSPLIISPVTYATTDQRISWITDKVNVLAQTIRGRELSENDLAYVAFQWIERLKIFSLFTKHVGFHEEKEWRIVYMSERDPNAALAMMHGYAITPRGAEPKLKLKIQPLDGLFSPDLSLENIIDRIILGPTAATALAASAVKRILQHKGKHTLATKIIPSSIPFRP